MINFKTIKRAALIALVMALCISFCGCQKAVTGSASQSSKSAAAISSSSRTSSGASSASASSSTQTSSAGSGQSSKGTGSKKGAVAPAKHEMAAAAPRAQAPNAQQPSGYSRHICLTIDGTKGNDGVVASNVQVGINAGDSVYTALRRYCSSKNILVAASQTGNGEYISAIDGISQFDFGAQSGWIYCVNGTFPQNDCNSYKLGGGESVKWIYTKDLGKSEGASK